MTRFLIIRTTEIVVEAETEDAIDAVLGEVGNDDWDYLGDEVIDLDAEEGKR
jgi:hypothetical protein